MARRSQNPRPSRRKHGLDVREAENLKRREHSTQQAARSTQHNPSSSSFYFDAGGSGFSHLESRRAIVPSLTIEASAASMGAFSGEPFFRMKP